MTYKQRLMLDVYKAVGSVEQGVSYPYGFKAYAKAASKCIGKKRK